MLYRENPIFGRKIFFCNPSLFIENVIVDALRQDDFEVYIINNYKNAKSLLLQYPDSICYIDIDSELSFSAWFNFIKSFSSEGLESIYVGIISETSKQQDMEKFLMNLKLPCGFININKKSDKLLNQFIDILDLNGAKGRRKYIRLDTTGRTEVKGYLSYQDKLYDINIKDISVAGFACSYKCEYLNIFKKNMHLQNVCINIKRKSLVVSCIIFNTFENKDGTATAVMMFTNENPIEMIQDIRAFIIEDYINKVDEVLKITSIDHNNYDEPNVYDDLKTDRSYIDDEDAEVLTDIEDLSEIDYETEDSSDNDSTGLYVPSKE